ncbi:putative Transglycosylase family protein, peptidoglycan binding protein [Frankia canadensis]|uniref:Putative Transglycosylase family protein, peptidoglycan binding protein n=1 Tax=Frankia canadensis TaxID=1836972 RepID=A0A2I2KR27_9ACTN|nr:peptidoglycan-binding protein [Frankia canadensis]SNQ48096.1 putative Transglycosylase family protein, peptidoglycan binding protein [Frankia canadensis]SOU55386.1 putative Transglycosylase family protein, peptidoglycan binding protein [Frankia canadensis]
MAKGKHRKRAARRRGATIAAAGVLGAGVSMLATAGPASAATGAVSDVTIAQVAANAGLSGCSGVPLSTWVAVALAESGGNTFAHATAGEDSRGLWQINMRAHAGWVGSRNLYDPATNAWAAKQVCSSQGVRAWSTWTNGMYTRFTARGQAAASAVGGGAAIRTISYTAAPVAAQVAAPVAKAAGYPSLVSGLGYRDDVRRIQQKLADLGYPIQVDGQFGYQTNHMVRDYQLKHGLLVDGVVGPQTSASLGL